jgi:hypothetical protein
LSSGAVLAGSGGRHATRRRLKGGGRGAVVLGMAGLAGLAVRIARPKAASGPARQPRFQIALPRGVAMRNSTSGLGELAVSPDGERVAFVGCKDRVCLLYVRERRELDARPLPDTEGASCPFFSPDGRLIGFGANDKLKKVAADGGPVVTSPTRRGSAVELGEDDTILFVTGQGGCCGSRPGRARAW